MSVLGLSFVGCSPKEPPPEPYASSTGPDGSSPDIGANIYKGSCVACHQQNAQGIPGVYPSLSGSPIVDGDPKALARWVILGKRPASLAQGRYATAMPQFGWLEPAAAAALFTYLRTHYGNGAQPVDAATVESALEEP
jgi:mono/diheme cytochrome c family protein